MRRLLPLLLPLLLLIVLPVRAAPPCEGGKLKSPIFRLPSVTLRAGAANRLKLTARHLDGLGIDISMTYDDAVVQVTNVTPGPAAEGHYVLWNVPESGLLKIAMFGTEPLSGNGTLLVISVAATYDTVPGQSQDRTALQLDVTVDEGAITACTIDGRLRIV